MLQLSQIPAEYKGLAVVTVVNGDILGVHKLVPDLTTAKVHVRPGRKIMIRSPFSGRWVTASENLVREWRGTAA